MQFQRETLDDWLVDLEPLILPHWEELTLDKDVFSEPYPDVEKFRDVQNQGKLLIVTARDNGDLVGYWVGAVLGHLHYPKAPPVCLTDMYFLHSAYRKGPTGIQLIEAAIQEAKKAGAADFHISCKVHEDHTKLFEAMKFKKTDYVFRKRLI
jgi:GNAT superfamily N-acetyltransferase